jgi:hypothetical protein
MAGVTVGPLAVLLFFTPGSAIGWERAFSNRPPASRPAEMANTDIDRLLERLLDSPDGIIQIQASTFDELAAAILPFSVTTPAPLELPWCAKNIPIDLKSVKFSISPVEISAVVTAKGQWCGVGFDIVANVPANVVYSATTREVTLTAGAGTARVTVDIPDAIDWHPGVPDKVSFDATVNFGSSLGAIPPIPVQAAAFTVDTPRGSKTFTLVGQNLVLLKQNGYIELRGDVALR